jgi:hypothetical protein
VQSGWVTTGKTCGLLVENLLQQLGKAPVSAVYNEASKCPGGCGWKADIHAATLAQNERHRGAWRARSRNGPEMGCYFSELLMASKFELSLVPRPFTAAMIAIAIPAAIRPYSMAVAPDSSLKNDLMIDKAALTGGTQLFRVVRR